jgi:hypothetical protein
VKELKAEGRAAQGAVIYMTELKENIKRKKKLKKGRMRREGVDGGKIEFSVV